MTKIVYVVTDAQGVTHEVLTKSQAEEMIFVHGGSYEIKYIEKASSAEAYCKKITRNPGSRT